MRTAKKLLAFLLVAVMAFSATTTAFAAEKATSLKLNATTIKWAVGKSGSFKPTVTPSGASTTLSWSSSDTKVATVSSAGKLTAKAVGTATITCKTTDGSNLKATCKVTVGKAVTSVKLNATTIKWPVGKAGSFKPTVSPSDAINKSLTWTSSNPKVATVSSAGKLTAVSAGTTTITCKAADGSGKYATCNVTVTGGATLATSLKLNATTIKWPIGKSGSFKPTVTPDSASKTLSWSSSDTKVATVSSEGKLTAKGAGTATITCKTTDGSNLKATCKVTVLPGVSEVKLNVSTLTWVTGRSGSFKATVLPEDASNKTLEWTSSDPEVATVSDTGKLTTFKVGTTTITCKATDGSGKYATCVVTVKKAVESIELNKSSLNLTAGESEALKATVNPADAYNKDVTWTSSNLAVATVSSSGVVTAKAAGTSKIMCQAKDGSGKYASCTVNVEKAPTKVSSVTLNTSSITWITGKSGSFKATVLPLTADNRAVEWSSSNTKVATVSSSGKLTAVSVGTATITCKATDGSGKYATCKVTVVKPVESVKLNVSSVSLLKGKTTTLSATVAPSDAYNKNVTWKSSNTAVATVSSKGVITAKASGNATITCTANDGSGKSASCTVKVGSKITSLTLNATSITWEKGKSGSFKPTIAPSDALNTTLSWKSLNPTVATITSAGKLTAVSAGTATIVCKTTDGSNKTVYCYVLVTDSSKPSTNYNKYFSNYFKDGAYTISGEVSVDADGEMVESDIKYGVNGTTTNICMEMNLFLLLPVKMLTRSDGMYLLMPTLKGYQKIEDADTTTAKLFSDLIYKGSGTEKINGTTYKTESFTPYGSSGLTVQFCFNSSGTLKCIKQIRGDAGDLLITNVKVSGTYTASDYQIPSGYSPLDQIEDEGWGELFG